jgi:hypothetical protein
MILKLLLETGHGDGRFLGKLITDLAPDFFLNRGGIEAASGPTLTLVSRV